MNSRVKINENLFSKFFYNEWLIILLLVIGSFARFYQLDFQSPWLDEVHTINEVDPKLSISEILNLIEITEPSPPFYFVATHYVAKFFGYSTYSIRFFSACLGVLGILSIYLLGKEMFNKKVGIIAASLLLFNHFHIYYSQEARMYSLFLFSSTLSYYCFVKFIKNPSYKFAIQYALGVTLLIYSHLFGFFVLLSQVVILLYHFILASGASRKVLLKFSLASGVLTILLYVPGFRFVFAAMGRDQIWIQAPTYSTMIEIFKDLFGGSGLVIIVLFLTTLVAILKLTAFKKSGLFFFSIGDSDRYNFFVLSIWLIVTVIVPLALSYIKLPMIVNRYLICILPAFLLASAVGLSYLKNVFIQVSFVLCFVVASGFNVIEEKHYYTQVNKQQFEKLTYLPIKSNELIVSRFAWYLPYFIQQSSKAIPITNKTIDLHIATLTRDSIELTPFWYIDLTFENILLSDSSRNFLGKNYHLDADYTFWGIKALHFIPKHESDFIAEIRLMKVKKSLEKEIFCDTQSYIDFFSSENYNLSASGWAFFNDRHSFNSKITAFLKRGESVTSIPVTATLRQDLNKAFNSKFDLDYSGFKIDFPTQNLPKGKYEFYFCVTNTCLDQDCIIPTKYTFEVG